MEASSSAPAVAKRGRGRPRKTPRIVAEPPTTSPGSLDAAQDDATEESTSRDNSARTESPIAAAVAVESDGVSTSGMAMDVEDAPATHSPVATHLRVRSADSVSPAAFFNSNDQGARKRTQSEMQRLQREPALPSPSVSSEAEEEPEQINDSGQVSPRRLRQRAIPQIKSSPAKKRPRISEPLESDPEETDISPAISAPSSKPTISLVPPEKDSSSRTRGASASRSTGSTSPEIATRTRAKRTNAEKQAPKKTTARGKASATSNTRPSPDLPKRKGRLKNVRAEPSSEDEHNSDSSIDEDKRASRSSTSASSVVQQRLGLRVPKVVKPSLARSKAGGSKNVSREASPALSVGGRTARERKRAENEITRARALATLAIEQELLKSDEHPILVTLLAKLAAEKEAREKSAKAYLERRLAEMDLLQASDERDVWCNWQENKRELRAEPLRKVEASMRKAYHEYWDKPEDRIYLPVDKAPGPSPFYPKNEDPKEHVLAEERWQPTIDRTHRPDWQLRDLEIQRDFKAMSFPPNFYPDQPTTDPFLLAPESSQLRSQQLPIDPASPLHARRSSQVIPRQVEGPQIGGFTARPTAPSRTVQVQAVVPSSSENRPQLDSNRDKRIDGYTQAANNGEQYPRYSTPPSRQPQVPSRRPNQPSGAGEALLKRLSQSASSLSSTPLPGPSAFSAAPPGLSDQTPRTMPAQRPSSRPPPFQMPASALQNVLSHANADSGVPRLHQLQQPTSGKA